MDDADDFRVAEEKELPSFKLETPDAAPALAKKIDWRKVERSEEHREAQRKGNFANLKRKDRRAGIPEPIPKKPDSKRTALQILLDMKRTENQEITRGLAEYVKETSDELGGWQSLRAGQRALLLGQKITLLVILAIEDKIVTENALSDEVGRPNPLLGVMERYLCTFRQGQIALGLGLKSRMVRSDNNLSKIMEEYQRRASGPKVVPSSKAHKTGE